MHLSAIQLCEAFMLICFGVSWPIDIIHTLRVKHASKKSLMFLMLIIFGYTAGIASKCLRSTSGGQPLEPVTWLYAANLALVVIDMALSYYYQVHDAANALNVAAPDEYDDEPRGAWEDDEVALAGVAGSD